ncbi:MAG TPA: hypothetical protein DCY88_09935 [Cyanobacteria bacterium UBA11372]|nr:hypothetical protein [Cyanobacteria bacterium UBA11372]
MTAYLVNQYPKASHSFIRREIAAMEACGVQVGRFALRSYGWELVDEARQTRAGKNSNHPGSSIAGLVLNLPLAALTRPVALLKALWLMLQSSKRSERNILYDLTDLAEVCVMLG